MSKTASNSIAASRNLRPALCVTGLIVNLLLLTLYHFPDTKGLLGDEHYYFHLARSIVADGSAIHHPFWPPFYAEFLAVLFRCFGERLLLLQLIQIVLWLLTGILFAQIAETVFQSRSVANLSLGLLLLHPELIAYSHFLRPETMHLFLFATALWLLIHKLHQSAAVISAGVSIGIALQTKLLLLPFLPLLILWMYKSAVGRNPNYQPSATLRAKPYRAIALFVASIIVVVVPTAYHNADTHGRWMLGDSSVFNLWLGLQDIGRRDYVQNIDKREFDAFNAAGETFSERQDVFRAKIQQFILDRGIWVVLQEQIGKQYFRLFHKESLFSSQFPGGPRERYRFSETPWSKLLRGYVYGMHALVLAFGSLGFCLLLFRQFGWVQLMHAFVVYNIGLFFFLHVTPRFLLQFLPILIVFAAYAIEQFPVYALRKSDTAMDGEGSGLPGQRDWKKLSRGSRKRLMAGLLLAVVVNYLAFGG